MLTFPKVDNIKLWRFKFIFKTTSTLVYSAHGSKLVLSQSVVLKCKVIAFDAVTVGVRRLLLLNSFLRNVD